MKILMISGGRGGVYRFTYEMASRLSGKSYSFFVVFVTGSKNRISPQLRNVPFMFLNNLTQWGKKWHLF
jgi:hypothetical protein